MWQPCSSEASAALGLWWTAQRRNSTTLTRAMRLDHSRRLRPRNGNACDSIRGLTTGLRNSAWKMQCAMRKPESEPPVAGAARGSAWKTWHIKAVYSHGERKEIAQTVTARTKHEAETKALPFMRGKCLGFIVYLPMPNADLSASAREKSKL